MSSLSELKAIEEQRMADERAAREAAVLAEIAAREALERAKVEAEEAKRRAAHEAQLAIENARVAAEREARMKIEAAEAAERARQQALLAEARLAQEMELRRAEIAKTRPTWMLIVTGIATLAAFALIYVAIDRTRATEQARTDKELAVLKAKQVREEFDDLQKKIAAIEAEGVALTEQSAKLDRDLKEANSAAERAEIAKRQAKHDAAVRAFNKKQADKDALKKKLQRIQEIKVSEECQKNSLC